MHLNSGSDVCRLWVLVVYCPFAHWIWNPQGFLAVWGVIRQASPLFPSCMTPNASTQLQLTADRSLLPQVVDFAGGIVVHISAGFAALASVFVVGPRQFSSDVHRELSRVRSSTYHPLFPFAAVHSR